MFGLPLFAIGIPLTSSLDTSSLATSSSPRFNGAGILLGAIEMDEVININTGGASGHQFLSSDRPKVVQVDVSAGSSAVFVGANGSGKTRLGASIEEMLGPRSHRIPAQRSIAMLDRVVVTDFNAALGQLLTGHETQGNRKGYRWGNDPYTRFLDDIEPLIRALFAQQNRALLDDHDKRKLGQVTELPVTTIDRLKGIWQSVLPHRTLIMRDASISVRPPPNPPGAGGDEPYSPKQLSDGERVIFYLIGQCLLAPDDGVIIVDEPELHIHPSISGALWDSLERERSDCAFIYLTHDIDFAANRVTAKKYFVRAIYFNTFWDIEPIPQDTGLPEQVVLELAGNRKPVLFVEGDTGSLDTLLYRSAYPHLKIEPVGSCDNVIHSVASFRANPTMHRWGAVAGCVDADQRTSEQIAQLEAIKVFPLCVAEIENVFLLPTVFLALASALSIPALEANHKFKAIRDSIFLKASQESEPITARYVARQLDQRLKRVTVDKKNTTNLKATFATEMASIDVSSLISQFQARLQSAISSNNLELVLEMYDQKGLLDWAAKALGLASARALMQQAARFLSDDKHLELRAAVIAKLPQLS